MAMLNDQMVLCTFVVILLSTWRLEGQQTNQTSTIGFCHTHLLLVLCEVFNPLFQAKLGARQWIRDGPAARDQGPSIPETTVDHHPCHMAIMAIMGFVPHFQVQGHGWSIFPQEKLNQTRSELDLTEEAKRKTHSSLFKAKKDGDRGAKPWGTPVGCGRMPPCHHSKNQEIIGIHIGYEWYISDDIWWYLMSIS